MFISFGRDFGRNHGEESPLSYDSDDEDHDGMNEDHDNTDGSLRHNGDDWDSENQIAFRFRDLLTTFLDVEPSEKNLNRFDFDLIIHSTSPSHTQKSASASVSVSVSVSL